MSRLQEKMTSAFFSRILTFNGLIMGLWFFFWGGGGVWGVTFSPDFFSVRHNGKAAIRKGVIDI